MDTTSTLPKDGREVILDPVAGVDYSIVRAAHPQKQMPLSIESIARMCHEVTRAWCDLIGDPALLPWDQAPDWQKNSSIAGVTFMMENPASTPIDQHNAWLKTKQEDGWKFGPLKDADKKEHPCFCSYNNLPWYQQAKDHLFQFTVRALAPLIVIPGQTRPITDGERIAGISFNPSGDWRINFMKGLYAELYDFIEKFEAEKDKQLKEDRPSDTFALKEVHRSAAVAKTELQTSKMYCIESLTR